MKLNGAFSPEEQERLLKAPNILADFFKRSAELGWTVAAEQIRSTYWEIETHATRLRRMAKGWQPGPMEELEVSQEAKRTLEAAADELDRLAKFSVRRSISELRQEPFKGRPNGPDRWVVLWSEDHRCSPYVARKLPEGWENMQGVAFATHGYTHFSELPTDDPSVL
jgi:hypothetical protein